MEKEHAFRESNETHRASCVGIAALLRRMLVATVVVVGWTAAPALAQMNSQSMYSDVWASNTTSAEARIVGCGVTDDDYNTWGHQYYVTTTLTSPRGRVATATSGTSGSYACAQVSLRFNYDNPDTGDWLVETDHYWCCPYISGGAFMLCGTSTSGETFSLDRTAYQHIGNYQYQPTCTSRCTENPLRYVPPYGNPPLYLQCEQLVSHLGGTARCLPGLCKGVPVPGTCGEVP